MVRQIRSGFKPSALFWVLVGFLGLVFFTGGGSRADIQSLVILRPVSVLVCGYGCWTLSWDQIRHRPFLFAFTSAIFGLVILQLIPLPPSIWGNLPGRAVILQVDQVASLGKVWRPISMVPSSSWNALSSLFVPLAVLLVGVQLSREEKFQLLTVLLGFGLLSGLIGLLQVVGGQEGPLYFYNVTNNGSAVGLFSNRNHQAMFLACLFPMLSVFAFAGLQTVEQWRFRRWVSIAAGLVIIPLLLVAGSRAGLLIGLFGLATVPLLYRKPLFAHPPKRKGRRIKTAYLFVGFGVVAIGLLTVLFARAKAFERLIAPDQLQDLRLSVWGPIAQMSWKYFPFGSGAGSFAEVYQIDEPLGLLSPSYLNHAHNDWLEVVMTTGGFGLTLLLIAVAAWAIATRRAWRLPETRGRETSYSRMASVVILMIALGSVGDYPLRVPSIMCVFVIATLWLCGERGLQGKNKISSSNGDGSPDESPLAA